MTIRELFKELIDFIMKVMDYVLIYLPSKIINFILDIIKFILDTPIPTLVEGFGIYFLLPAGIFGIIIVLADKYKKK